MKLRSLTIAGFGRLHDLTLTFADGLNVIYGPNEAGKSTVAAAITASLYGAGRRKDAWRPWNGGAYGTTLVYALADGRTFEVQRDYTRDAKGVRIYDADGNDVAAQVASGRNIAPGEAHLHVPHDVFVNTSCVLQQSVEIDVNRQEPIATALARALDGGPKEDAAALSAVKRLEDARRTFVGTPRASVNHPLRAAQQSLAARERELQDARNARDRLAQVRERRAAAIDERDRIAERRSVAEAESRSMRAADLRARLEELRTYRDDLAAQRVELGKYADVAGFPADRVTALGDAFYAWQTADGLANAAETAAAEAQPTTAEHGERRAREIDGGALDDVEFSALRIAAEQAAAARATASAAASEAAAARREGSGGRSINGVVLATAGVFTLLTIGMAIAHWWSFTEVFAVIAIVAIAIIGWRSRGRLQSVRAAADKQRIADESLANERLASAAVAAVLERLDVPSVDELGRRRERLAELRRAAEQATRLAERATALRAAEVERAAEFDALAAELVPDATGSRRSKHDAATERARRRRERDGVGSGIAMLAVRRSEILRGEDEFALIAERDALAAAGIVPLEGAARGAGDAARATIAELDRLFHDADKTVAQLSTELDLGEAAADDLATLDEEVERLRAEVARLEALDRALELALTTLQRITHEAHQVFARWLETYAAEPLRAVTGGRYAELRVDPASLVVKVRVPETGAIEGLEVLSSGTRDQVYLIVRFAMARMFAEGLETPPLLLDDPFAYWDEARIARCLPIVANNAFGAQTMLFTSNAELAAAAEAAGAARIDLGANVPA